MSKFTKVPMTRVSKYRFCCRIVLSVTAYGIITIPYQMSSYNGGPESENYIRFLGETGVSRHNGDLIKGPP